MFFPKKEKTTCVFNTCVSLYFIKAKVASKPIIQQQTPAFLILVNPAH